MNISERTGRGTWMNLPGLRFAAMPATPFPRLRVLVPLVSTKVSAGFPSPADDHVEAIIDLNELLVCNPASAAMYLPSFVLP